MSVLVSPTSVDDERVRELLAAAVGGDHDSVERIAKQYRQDSALTLLGARLDDALVGVAGYTVASTDVVVLHIATGEKFRRRGIGRQMLHAVREATPSHFSLVAETDSDAVGFYIAHGFAVTSLGEKYPGVERFRVCLPRR